MPGALLSQRALANEGSVSSCWVTRYCTSVSCVRRSGLLVYSGIAASQAAWLHQPFWNFASRATALLPRGKTTAYEVERHVEHRGRNSFQLDLTTVMGGWLCLCAASKRLSLPAQRRYATAMPVPPRVAPVAVVDLRERNDKV